MVMARCHYSAHPLPCIPSFLKKLRLRAVEREALVGVGALPLLLAIILDWGGHFS